MSLADQIIENGPYIAGDRVPAALGGLLRAEELNELREELLAARPAREVMERFEVRAQSYSEADTVLACNRCRAWEGQYDEALGLAELVQRAGEHAEVCP